jgi:hypothetical protein
MARKVPNLPLPQHSFGRLGMLPQRHYYYYQGERPFCAQPWYLMVVVAAAEGAKPPQTANGPADNHSYACGKPPFSVDTPEKESGPALPAPGLCHQPA